jgi:hypothetical protein
MRAMLGLPAWAGLVAATTDEPSPGWRRQAARVNQHFSCDPDHAWAALLVAEGEQDEGSIAAACGLRRSELRGLRLAPAFRARVRAHRDHAPALASCPLADPQVRMARLAELHYRLAGGRDERGLASQQVSRLLRAVEQQLHAEWDTWEDTETMDSERGTVHTLTIEERDEQFADLLLATLAETGNLGQFCDLLPRLSDAGAAHLLARWIERSGS